MSQLFNITCESPGSTPYEFTGVDIGTGCAFAPSSTHAYAGTQSYIFTVGTSSRTATGYKTISSATEIWLRGYFYIASDWSFSGGYSVGNHLLEMMTSEYGTSLLLIQLQCGGSAVPNQWRITGQGIDATTSTTNFSLGSWHFIELHWKQGASSNAIHHVRVDGTQIFNSTTGTSGGSCTRLVVGSTAGDSATGSSWADNIDAWDTDPSTQPAPQTSNIPIIVLNLMQQGFI